MAPPMPRQDPDPEPNGTGPLPSRRGGGGPVEPRHARVEVIDEGDGLPKRVRQSSMAPQLRESPPVEDDNTTQAGGTRSPEELRAMMTSFQSGMNRGRRDAEEDIDVEPEATT